MTQLYRQTLFSPEVRAQQDRMGSRRAYSLDDDHQTEPDRLTAAEAAFIMARDSFYMATNGADGWPYVQHRGGPRGFVHVLDDRTLGFADFRGNRQYITLGNVQTDNRASLFFMDYLNQARLKLLGRVRAVALEKNSDLARQLVPEAYRAHPERALLIEVHAYDWNCSQHIPQRVLLEEANLAVAQMRTRIAELEAMLPERA